MSGDAPNAAAEAVLCSMNPRGGQTGTWYGYTGACINPNDPNYSLLNPGQTCLDESNAVDETKG